MNRPLASLLRLARPLRPVLISRPPLHRFSSSQGEQDGQEKSRQTQAEEENPHSQNKKENLSRLRKAHRFFWYSTYLMVGLNLGVLYLDDQDSPLNMLTIYPYSSMAQYLRDTYVFVYDFITKPPSSKLLPDQIHIKGFTREPPKTLVLDLSGTLIHQEYEMGKGMLVIKRPGLTQFIKRLAQKYEIILFSNEDFQLISSVADKLDPHRSIFHGRFGTESMVFEAQGKVKDLKYLNRDLRRVVVVDKDSQMVRHHSSNAIILPKFEGDQDDNRLYELLPFLEYLASPQVTDVRQEMTKYGANPDQAYLQHLGERKQRMEQRKQAFSFGRFQGSK